MSEVPTTADGGPPDLEPVPVTGALSRRRRRARVAVLVALLVVAAAGIVASKVHLPYYSVGPGGTFDTALLVSVERGHDVEAAGSVAFPTVSMGRVTVLEALIGWLDGDVDVIREEKVLPADVDADELRQLNLRLMAGSKEKAIGVALEHLGYDAIRGGGAEIVQVLDGSAASGVLVVGEVILAIDGSPVTLDAEAVALVGTKRPGDRIRLSVRTAAGTTRDVEVELGKNPDDASRPRLGVSLQTAELSFVTPFKVDIDSQNIGGPSAGLAFTLEVLDRLTLGELTGGHRVAATGTIELDGRVGDIGGIRQKTAAVIDAGYELFLVPRGELGAARDRAGSKVRVVAVDDLQDALRAMAELGGNSLALGTLPGIS